MKDIIEEIKIVITKDDVEEYCNEYFEAHPRAQKKPITSPLHPSINQYYNLSRMAYANLKNKWKDFGVWIVKKNGLEDKHIKRCEMIYKIYYPQNRRRDLDNVSPKFIWDAFVEAGLFIDDDCKHISKLTLLAEYSKGNPKSEFIIYVLEPNDEEKE